MSFCQEAEIDQKITNFFRVVLSKKLLFNDTVILILIQSIAIYRNSSKK